MSYAAREPGNSSLLNLSGKVSIAVSRFAMMAKNIFPLTLSNEVVLNWLTVLEFGLFGVNISSASFYDFGTPPSSRATFRKLLNRLRSIRYILFTLYEMALGPSAIAVLAFLTTSYPFQTSVQKRRVNSLVPLLARFGYSPLVRPPGWDQSG